MQKINIIEWDKEYKYPFCSKADTKVQQSVVQLPWRHNVVIINKTRNKKRKGGGKLNEN